MIFLSGHTATVHRAREAVLVWPFLADHGTMVFLVLFVLHCGIVAQLVAGIGRFVQALWPLHLFYCATQWDCFMPHAMLVSMSRVASPLRQITLAVLNNSCTAAVPTG